MNPCECESHKNFKGDYCPVCLIHELENTREALRATEWELYRPLEEGEMTQPGDQVVLPDEDAKWEETSTIREVPNPLYPAHCHYRRNRVKELESRLAAKEAELATCQRLYSEQRDRKNQYAEELSALSNDRNSWFDKAMELSRELAQARKHSGKCVECGTWTCGYCGISDSEGKWHCKTCQK